jgi:GT2 family glycosyltransferase
MELINIPVQDVSVIIVNYKTITLVVNAIHSIRRYTLGISYEIIVVDNASCDNFKEILYNEFGDVIICISLKENIGFGRANNEGIKVAKGRNILFLNSDTLLLNNAIKVLSDYLDENEFVGACGGNLYDENMLPTHSYDTIFPSITRELNLYKLFHRKYKDFNTTGSPRKVAYITGADLMVKSSVLTKTGGFCDKFFMYYEETELCFRIHKRGYKIISLPFAKIQHLQGKSFSSNFSRNKVLYIEHGREIFYTICYSSIYKKVAGCIHRLLPYVKCCISRVILRDKHRYWKWHVTVKKLYHSKNV